MGKSSLSPELQATAYKLWCTNDIKTLLPPPDPERLKAYNDVPVKWCKHCLSLKVEEITKEGKSIDHCGNCGTDHIVTGHIQEWKELHKNRYNI